MEGNAPRGSGPRAWGLAILVVALVAAVAVASTGSVPDGSGGARRPSEQLVDTAVSLLLVFLALGSVAVVLLLGFFRREDTGLGGASRARRSPASAVVSLIVGLGLAMLALRAVSKDGGAGGGNGRVPGAGGIPGLAEEQAGRYEPRFAPWPVIVILFLAVAALTGAWLARRARRVALGEVPSEPELALAAVLDETLDDLKAEGDPRRAVISAYSRMERALAAAGMPRREAEAPQEYLERVLGSAEISTRAAGRLTGLFTWARFSAHDVGPAMKDEAIETLERVRDELRAAEAARAHARTTAARGLATGAAR